MHKKIRETRRWWWNPFDSRTYRDIRYRRHHCSGFRYLFFFLFCFFFALFFLFFFIHKFHVLYTVSLFLCRSIGSLKFDNIHSELLIKSISFIYSFGAFQINAKRRRRGSRFEVDQSINQSIDLKRGVFICTYLHRSTLSFFSLFLFFSLFYILCKYHLYESKSCIERETRQRKRN